jgi:hypothetical protein
MQHFFGEHIGLTIEAYVDDIVVKTKRVSSLVDDLDAAFKCLKAKNIKLNPEKCVFGIPRGMLLEFIVSERGIEANPENITAITKMGPIHDLKGVQRVTGCHAALCIISYRNQNTFHGLSRPRKPSLSLRQHCLNLRYSSRQPQKNLSCSMSPRQHKWSARP